MLINIHISYYRLKKKINIIWNIKLDNFIKCDYFNYDSIIAHLYTWFYCYWVTIFNIWCYTLDHIKIELLVILVKDLHSNCVK